MDFFGNFEKISVLSNFPKKFRFWSKFTKDIDFFENLEKFRFCQIFEKISILVKFSKNFDFGHNFRKNFEFGQIFSKKFRFWSIFRKLRKMSILVKFS